MIRLSKPTLQLQIGGPGDTIRDRVESELKAGTRDTEDDISGAE